MRVWAVVIICRSDDLIIQYTCGNERTFFLILSLERRRNILEVAK